MNLKPLIFLALAASPMGALAQSVSLGASAVQENFDSLAASGTSSSLPTGWYLVESGTNANTTYAADNGATASGNTYSYGTGTASERALGLLLSGSLTPTVGVQITNNTGSTLTSFELSYRGEQWRLGTAGREDKLDVEYSTDATSLTTGTWTSAPTLTLVAPITAGTAGSALDGNAPANQRTVSGSISGLNVLVGGTVWVRWRDFNASSSDDGLAIDDVVIAPAGGGADVAPTVTATVPTAGATVAADTTLTISFSEPVTAAAGAFALSCDMLAQAFTQSGGPSSFSLDPNDPLPASASCTVTVSAAAITDLDGSADPMQADHTVAFTVAAPPVDVAPTVSSTTPSHNAGNVAIASTVTIVFSEPVDVTAPWFTFNCTVSGAITAAVSGSDANRVLTPSAPLAEAETCTVIVLAAQVLDRDGTADPMAMDHSFSFGTTVGVGDYYAGVDATSTAALRATLHAVIDDHTVFPYSGGGTSTWTILELADEDPSDPGRILDVYRNCSYEKVTSRSGQAGSTTCGDVTGRRYNREHTWPNSLGFSSSTGNLGLPNAPYTDTHMLYLSDETYNSDRGNKPFADCSSGCGERPTVVHAITGGGGSGAYPGNSNWVLAPDGNTGSFEVWTSRKGDMARAVLYMDIRYEGGTHGGTGQTEPDLVVTDNRALIQMTSSSPAYMGLLSTLIAWHQADPPDTRERARNDVVYSYQGNRNPFIDHPEWVGCLFQSICPASAYIFRNGFEAAASP